MPLLALIGLLCLFILAPVIVICAIGATLMILKAVLWCVAILLIVVPVVFLVLLCDPKERAAMRLWIAESRAKKHGPQS